MGSIDPYYDDSIDALRNLLGAQSAEELNYIHPFREGNGRAQRVFWSRVAYDAGYIINWSLVSANENDEASRAAAEEMDRAKLKVMFTRIVESVPTA